jgi:anti-anti-sigma factor
MNPQTSALTVQTERLDGADVIHVSGTIDYWSVAPLRQELDLRLAMDTPRIVLDLDDVPFCDSTGLGLFLAAQQRAEKEGGWLRLVRPHLQMQRVLTITRLSQRLRSYPSVDAALNGQHEK